MSQKRQLRPATSGPLQEHRSCSRWATSCSTRRRGHGSGRLCFVGRSARRVPELCHRKPVTAYLPHGTVRRTACSFHLGGAGAVQRAVETPSEWRLTITQRPSSSSTMTFAYSSTSSLPQPAKGEVDLFAPRTAIFDLQQIRQRGEPLDVVALDGVLPTRFVRPFERKAQDDNQRNRRGCDRQAHPDGHDPKQVLTVLQTAFVTPGFTGVEGNDLRRARAISEGSRGPSAVSESRFLPGDATFEGPHRCQRSGWRTPSRTSNREGEDAVAAHAGRG